MRRAMVTGLLTLLAGVAPAQITQIMPAGLLPDQQTLDFTAGTAGPISASDPLFTSFGLTDVRLTGTWAPGGDVLSQCVMGNAIASVSGQLAVVAPSGALDNPSGQVGWEFELARKVTQAGFIPVDECCWSLQVDFFDGGAMVGTIMIGSVQNCVPMLFESAVPFDEVHFIALNSFGGWGLDDLVLAGFQGPSCTITSPTTGSSVFGTVSVDLDFDHVAGLPLDATFEFSTDAGVTFAPATAAGMLPNPATGILVPAMLTFDWDTIADGVGVGGMPQTTTFRTTVDDGMMMQAECSVDVDVDNVPTCALLLTSSQPVRDDASFDVTPMSVSSMLADATFEFSTDAGVTFLPATAAASSMNPLVGIPVGAPSTFVWDSRTDGVGTMAVSPGVLLRATIDDGVGMATCVTLGFDVDNTSLCGGTCGDCDLSGTGPDVIDALTAAQLAAGLLTPSSMQDGCCDVDSSMSVTVLDALGIAQAAAGLPAMLTCP